VRKTEFFYRKDPETRRDSESRSNRSGAHRIQMNAQKLRAGLYPWDVRNVNTRRDHAVMNELVSCTDLYGKYPVEQ